MLQNNNWKETHAPALSSVSGQRTRARYARERERERESGTEISTQALVGWSALIDSSSTAWLVGLACSHTERQREAQAPAVHTMNPTLYLSRRVHSPVRPYSPRHRVPAVLRLCASGDWEQKTSEKRDFRTFVNLSRTVAEVRSGARTNRTYKVALTRRAHPTTNPTFTPSFLSQVRQLAGCV